MRTTYQVRTSPGRSICPTAFSRSLATSNRRELKRRRSTLDPSSGMRELPGAAKRGFRSRGTVVSHAYLARAAEFFFTTTTETARSVQPRALPAPGHGDEPVRVAKVQGPRVRPHPAKLARKIHTKSGPRPSGGLGMDVAPVGVPAATPAPFDRVSAMDQVSPVPLEGGVPVTRPSYAHRDRKGASRTGPARPGGRGRASFHQVRSECPSQTQPRIRRAECD